MLTYEMLEDGLHLYDSDEEMVGIICYEEGLYIVEVFGIELREQYHSVEAAKYRALAEYIECKPHNKYQKT